MEYEIYCTPLYQSDWIYFCDQAINNIFLTTNYLIFLMIGNTSSAIKSTHTRNDSLKFVYFERVFGVVKCKNNLFDVRTFDLF